MMPTETDDKAHGRGSSTSGASVRGLEGISYA